jgi:hypothetical protein
VLIIYNGMLFAVVVLLVGATPVSLADISPRLARWLRLGIVIVAALALIVSLYALAAILYRTALDRLTPNRLAFIGWNVVNIGLLFLVLFFQARAKAEPAMKNTRRLKVGRGRVRDDHLAIIGQASNREQGKSGQRNVSLTNQKRLD